MDTENKYQNIFSDFKMKTILLSYLDQKVAPTLQLFIIDSFNFADKFKLFGYVNLFQTNDRITKKLSPSQLAAFYYKQLPLKDKEDFIKFCFSSENRTAKKFAIAVDILYTSIALTDPDQDIRSFASFCYKLYNNSSQKKESKK